MVDDAKTESEANMLSINKVNKRVDNLVKSNNNQTRGVTKVLKPIEEIEISLSQSFSSTETINYT